MRRGNDEQNSEQKNKYELGERFIAAKAGQNILSAGLLCTISHDKKIAKLVNGSFPEYGLAVVSTSALKRGEIGLFTFGVEIRAGAYLGLGRSKVKIKVKNLKGRKGKNN